MSDTTNFKDTTKITSKDVSYLMMVSVRTAEQYYTDIKNHFDIKVVLYKHFRLYFKI